MKAVILSVVLLVSNASGGPEEKQVVNSIWTSMSQVEGTVLWRSDSSTSPEGSNDATRNFTIGYMTTNGEKESFVPILILPALKNDAYVTSVADGALKITTEKTDRIVLTLNLRNFQPLALSK